MKLFTPRIRVRGFFPPLRCRASSLFTKALSRLFIAQRGTLTPPPRSHDTQWRKRRGKVSALPRLELLSVLIKREAEAATGSPGQSAAQSAVYFATVRFSSLLSLSLSLSLSLPHSLSQTHTHIHTHKPPTSGGSWTSDRVQHFPQISVPLIIDRFGRAAVASGRRRR